MTTETFEAKVHGIVSTVTRDESGKLQLPEGLDEATAFGVTTEIRRRDTQSAFSKVTAKAKQLETENQRYISGWEQDVIDTLTAKESAELEELKHTDPDAWRTKLNELQTTKKSKLAERRAKITTEAATVIQEESRAEILSRFEAQYPGILTEEVLNNDIPPRLVKNLEEGKVDFEGFLQSCVEFMTKGRTLDKGTQAPNTVDLSKLPGGGSPSEAAVTTSDIEQYRKSEW